jgi:hypothetical protein
MRLMNVLPALVRERLDFAAIIFICFERDAAHLVLSIGGQGVSMAARSGTRG